MVPTPPGEDSGLDKAYNLVGSSLLITFITLAIVVCWALAGCTVSLQNISTHGSATDLVDENQSTTPKVDATVSVPMPPGML